MKNGLAHKKSIPLKESFSYSAYFIGQNLIYWLVTSYLLLFYTDYIFLPAGVVTAMLLLSKVWDAVNDPIFGMIVDKTQFKKGKFLPWIQLSTVLLPLVTALLFLVPAGASLGVRIGMAALGYFLWDMVYTVSDVPIYALSTAMTDDVKARGRLISFARLGASFGGMLISLLVPPMIERLGYLTPVLIICALCYLTMLPICIFGKERAAITPHEEKQNNFREMFAYLKANRYLLLIFGAICVKDAFNVALGTYVAKYCLGSLDYLSIITIASIVPVLLTYVFVPFILQYTDKIVLYRVSFAVFIALGIAMYFVGYQNITLYLVFTALRAFMGGIPGILMFTFAADCVEYGHYKSGIRKEGITFSIQTFTAKFTAAISAALSGVVLMLMQYDGTAAVQSAEVAKQFWFYANWVPVLGAALCMPLLLAYKLRDKDVQIMADANEGRITREQAQSALSMQY